METMALRRRNRIAPIAGALGADKRAAAAARAARRAPAAPRRAAMPLPTPAADLCATCLLFNESVRRYLPEHHNKFPSCDSPKCYSVDICKQTQSHSVNLPKRRKYRVYKSCLSRVMAVYLVDLPVLFMAMFSFTRSFQFVESERDCYEAAMFHSNKHVYPK